MKASKWAWVPCGSHALELDKTSTSFLFSSRDDSKTVKENGKRESLICIDALHIFIEITVEYRFCLTIFTNSSKGKGSHRHDQVHDFSSFNSREQSRFSLQQ